MSWKAAREAVGKRFLSAVFLIAAPLALIWHASRRRHSQVDNCT